MAHLAGQSHLVCKEQEAMRKLIFGAAAICLVVGALGVYIARQASRQTPLLPNLEEEQETPAVTPFPLGDLARHMQPTVDRENAIEAVEPIVVEGPALEPSTVTEIGGERVPGENVPVVVTSAPRALALARLERAGVPVPSVLVTAEDVTRGKPAPDCFLLAARKLGVEPGDCLVWEDAPSGIAAAEAAGATVLVVTATHAHPMATSHPVVASYEGLAAGLDAAGRLTIALAGSRAARPASP